MRTFWIALAIIVVGILVITLLIANGQYWFALVVFIILIGIKIPTRRL